MYLFVHSFIHLFIYLFIDLFIHSFGVMTSTYIPASNAITQAVICNNEPSNFASTSIATKQGGSSRVRICCSCLHATGSNRT